MANEKRYYPTAFAESGIRAEIPDISVGGAVGLDTGYGSDYELPQGDPNRRRIEKDLYNGMFNGVTGNIKQWQEVLYPTWIEDDGNAVPFSYSSGMTVSHASQGWLSVEDLNQEEPGTGNKWIEFNLNAIPVLSTESIAHKSLNDHLADNPVGFNTVQDMIDNNDILAEGYTAVTRGNALINDKSGGTYLIESGLTPDGDKIHELRGSLVAVEQPTVPLRLDVMDFNFSSVFRRESDYDTSGDLIWGFAHTGQSLAEGGVGNDPVTGISPPLYPDQALMLAGGPVGLGTGSLGGALIALEEPARVTIGTSYTRKIVEDNGVGSGFQAIFHGQAFGGQNYTALKKGAALGVFEKVISQAIDVKVGRPNVEYKAVSCIHGEQDGLDNNVGYAADLAEWAGDFDTDLKSVTGQVTDVQFLLCQTATAGAYGFNGGITEITFPTPIEQLEAHVNNANITMVCSKYHIPYFDHSHITNNAQRVLGEYYSKAFAAIEAGPGYEPLRPSSVAGVGSTVVIDFIGNVGSLVFDTTLVNAATNQGFDYVDDSARAIVSVAVTGAAQVTLTLDGAVGANPFVSYAYHNGDGGTANQISGNGDRGNLRDSDTAVSLYNGDPLYNWTVIFREVVL